MKLFLSLMILTFISSTYSQDRLAQCRAELENVNNEATAQIKNLTDTINEYIKNSANDSNLGEILKEKMKKTAEDVKGKWNEFGNTMKNTFEQLGGKITNAWKDVFGDDATTTMATLPNGVKITTQTLSPDFSTPPPTTTFWDKVRGFFG